MSLEDKDLMCSRRSKRRRKSSFFLSDLWMVQENKLKMKRRNLKKAKDTDLQNTSINKKRSRRHLFRKLGKTTTDTEKLIKHSKKATLKPDKGLTGRILRARPSSLLANKLRDHRRSNRQINRVQALSKNEKRKRGYIDVDIKQTSVILNDDNGNVQKVTKEMSNRRLSFQKLKINTTDTKKLVKPSNQGTQNPDKGLAGRIRILRARPSTSLLANKVRGHGRSKRQSNRVKVLAKNKEVKKTYVDVDVKQTDVMLNDDNGNVRKVTKEMNNSKSKVDKKENSDASCVMDLRSRPKNSTYELRRKLMQMRNNKAKNIKNLNKSADLISNKADEENNKRLPSRAFKSGVKLSDSQMKKGTVINKKVKRTDGLGSRCSFTSRSDEIFKATGEMQMGKSTKIDEDVLELRKEDFGVGTDTLQVRPRKSVEILNEIQMEKDSKLDENVLDLRSGSSSEEICPRTLRNRAHSSCERVAKHSLQDRCKSRDIDDNVNKDTEVVLDLSAKHTDIKAGKRRSRGRPFKNATSNEIEIAEQSTEIDERSLDLRIKDLDKKVNTQRSLRKRSVMTEQSTGIKEKTLALSINKVISKDGTRKLRGRGRPRKSEIANRFKRIEAYNEVNDGSFDLSINKVISKDGTRKLRGRGRPRKSDIANRIKRIEAYNEINDGSFDLSINKVISKDGTRKLRGRGRPRKSEIANRIKRIEAYNEINDGSFDLRIKNSDKERGTITLRCHTKKLGRPARKSRVKLASKVSLQIARKRKATNKGIRKMITRKSRKVGKKKFRSYRLRNCRSSNEMSRNNGHSLEKNSVNMKELEVNEISTLSSEPDLSNDGRLLRKRDNVDVINVSVDNGRQLRANRSYVPCNELWMEESDNPRSYKEVAYYSSYNLADKQKNSKFVGNGTLKYMADGCDLNKIYFDKNGFNSPILVHRKRNLGLTVPSSNFTVSDVCELVGPDRIVDVIDVHTQKDIQMSMNDYKCYVESDDRDKLYNIISLEISQTKLGEQVIQPEIVREIDWIDLYWPESMKRKQIDGTNTLLNMMYPKVQKYCLMSVKGCYTDFHVDFGGTSVWYYVVRGTKVFWLAPPTEHNLEMYRQWLLTDKMLTGTSSVFLGDWLEYCERVVLKADQTFFIPSGWLHAVYTPKDTIVFGGNFLHSYSVDMQFKVFQFEDELRVQKKCRFPYFDELHWFVLDGYIQALDPHSYSKYKKITDNIQLKSTINESTKLLMLRNLKYILEYFEKCLTDVKNTAPEGLSYSGELLENAIALLNSHGDLHSDKEAENVENVNKEAIKVCCRITEVCAQLKKVTAILDDLNMVPDLKKSEKVQLTDPMKLLKDAVGLFDDHNTDSCGCAYSYAIQRIENKKEEVETASPAKRGRKRSRVESFNTNPGTVIPDGDDEQPKPKRSTLHPRRKKCRKCSACLGRKCNRCKVCLDKSNYSGRGKRKLCIQRKCKRPIFPSTLECAICKNTGVLRYVDYMARVTVNDDYQSMTESNTNDLLDQLMECHICQEVVHPRCLFKVTPNLRGYNVEENVNDQLTNSWRCAKCSNAA